MLDTNYFFAVENPYYLLIILNSKLITWWINSEDTQIGAGGAFRHYKYNLEKLCIPHEMKELEDQNMLDFTNSSFDSIIYKHYGLSDDEADFINNYITDLEQFE